MADPICRWRNPYIDTVLELITILPKEEMLKDQAREIINLDSPYKAKFFTTPYQLACQLGLYYEEGNYYFPKFNYIPTRDELNDYLKNWIVHYCIPNPYTRDFDGIESFSVHDKLCRLIYSVRGLVDWNTAISTVFEDSIGNSDILKNSIHCYSPVICVENGVILLKEGKTYDDLLSYIDIGVIVNRDNKEDFFDLFEIPERIDENSNINIRNQIGIDSNLTHTEKERIILARVGQGYFRRELILDSGFCPITEVNDPALLIASHIKPWKDSDNLERINPKNGLLLTPTYDKLFDRGFISFSNDCRLLVSTELSRENKKRLNLVSNSIYSSFPIDGRELFLDFHRNNVFRE